MFESHISNNIFSYPTVRCSDGEEALGASLVTLEAAFQVTLSKNLLDVFFFS